MDLPPAPRDTGLRNIIDKLAEFVARNGPEFEAITKAKQKGNPKFEFLYGGDYYNYYQYRVASEQSFLKQQASISQAQHHNQQQSPSSMSQLLPGQHTQHPPHTQHSQQMGFTSQSMTMNQPPGMNPQTLWNNGSTTTNPSSNLTSQIETINMQQNTLRDQIRQSELNLSAQHGVLLQQQQKQIDEAITKAQNESVQKQAEDNNIRLAEFDAILQPIIESCTKDSISTGKNWILQHTSDTAKCNVVLQYLLKKALVNGSTFSQKLHLIYLVNDVLHHCVRKNANDLKSCLENVVIPMFCSADIIASDDQKGKLSKLLSLWESKAKFFDACVISKLRSPESSMQEYKTNLMNVHNTIVTQFTQATKAALDSYQQQHQVFIQHASQQIAMLESQKQTLEQQVLASVLPNTSVIPPLMDPQQLQSQTLNSSNVMGTNGGMNSIQMQANNNNIPIQANSLQMSGNNAQMSNSNTPLMSNSQKPPPLMAQQVSLPSDGLYSNSSIGSPQSQHSNQNLYAVGVNNSSSSNSPYQQQSLMGYPQSFGQLIGNSNSDYTSPPPSFQIPDLSKPPPGFSSSVPQPPPPVIEEEVKPSAPYYELPAGLMVPLIRLEDYSYKPLDPEEIRIPPPSPQNERLSNAVVAFYSLPSHDRPRDVEGWEKLGLYEYYKVKNAAKKQKEEKIQSGVRDKSRSPSPIVLEPTKPKKPNKRCYRSKSKSRSRSKSASRSPRRSRTRSRSPERNRSRYSANRRSRSPRRSPIRERERERERDRDRERERDRDRGKERERERERERSVTPPSFFGGSYAKSNEFIEETNKGHQMLMKMGWGGSGTGLGPKNQGIDSPIPGGEVRDRKDMYKGVGININDPYENFRKNKGAAFIHRMRSRAEEKS